MPFPKKNSMSGLGGPPASPVFPKGPAKFGGKKKGKKKPSNKTNKFARALSKAPRDSDSDYY